MLLDSILVVLYGRLRREKKRDYSNITPPQPGPLSYSDSVYNLFLRLAIERNPSRIVELGAYTGSRSIALKKALPNCEIIGLDIGTTFAKKSHKAGCIFDHFDRLVDYLTPQTLVLVNGTLTYMVRNEVRDLFQSVLDGGASFCAMEPARLKPGRRGRTGYYHALGEISHELGADVWLNVPIIPRTFSLKMLEYRQVVGFSPHSEKD